MTWGRGTGAGNLLSPPQQQQYHEGIGDAASLRGETKDIDSSTRPPLQAPDHEKAAALEQEVVD